ncbi:MAG TPA: 4Fe-4S ferredoxin [Pseudolabrys sp.]|nr:4Fe-4S ferredoxin [Pseudolabrys sp.]
MKPNSAPPYRPLSQPLHLDRRSALKLFSAGLALSLAGCGRPYEQIVPYVDMPEGLVPGVPQKYATTLALNGYGRGMLVTSIDGRPIKVEGNPRHPASLGATDVFAEAAIMSLYDPNRSKVPVHDDDITTWDIFNGALYRQIGIEKARHGSGLRLVTGRVTSPTLQRQIAALQKTFPQAHWYSYEPVTDDNALAGSELAYGKRLTSLPRLGEAAVVLSLDADPLGPGPAQIANGHAFATRRRRDSNPFMRLYAVEGEWTLTGANADHRVALHPQLVRNFALHIADHLAGKTPSADLPQEAARIARAAAADLKAHKGKALVTVGRRQPPEVHALAHWINAQLSAPVDHIAPVEGPELRGYDGLRALADDIASGEAQTVIIIGANPVYDAPASLGIAEKLAKVRFSVQMGLHDDETGAVCHWHLPLTHPLEAWSDLRAFDGTASVVQPLIRPLYDTRTAHQLIAYLNGEVAPSSYDLVRETWQTDWQHAPHQSNAQGTFDDWWKRVLHDGVIHNTAAAHVSPGTPKRPDLPPAQAPQGMSLVLGPDPSVWDGSFANNPWLQECPHPFTKDVWGNNFHISPNDGKQLQVKDGDLIEVTHDRQTIKGPVRIREQQADGLIVTTLGYGRTRAGSIGNFVGFSASAIRPLHKPWLIDGIKVKATGDHHPIPTVQHQFRLEGKAKDLYPTMTLAELAKGKNPPEHDEHEPTLLPKYDYDTYAWAMVIDTSVCIGCNACVISCQAENNVPVVGPDQILAGRNMHWLRVDRYEPDPGKPPGFQPVPCMQCEKAPCEPVCPVEASVHDGEGLNDQVYNRCIGTRFCQANCPYKVRRFNFFGWADGEEYADLGADIVKAHYNPDVTVRARGVMEKCTYCVQRISRARHKAETEDRPIAEGEIVTACQAACPTNAITFGDKNNRNSRVNKLRDAPNHYDLLGHLGTKPRTTYLAYLRNPNPALETEA